MESIDKTYCIACGKLLAALPILYEGSMALMCNNPECPRFGLFTGISAPESNENKHKKVL